jgi:pimeloyl-ACP methyl ester carboxylesterase
VTLIKGERGILSDEMAEVVYERLGDTASLIEIPDAGHHIMLDQPLALVAALRTLLVGRERRAARAVSVEPE